MKRLITCVAFAATLAALAWAGQTRTWVETDYSDYEKGVLKGLSLRSDGRLTLAPRFEELYDSPSAYLWTLARDSKGNLYTGGGPGAKLYRISPKGEKKTLAELDGLEVHSIVVAAKDGSIYAAAVGVKQQISSVAPAAAPATTPASTGGSMGGGATITVRSAS